MMENKLNVILKASTVDEDEHELVSFYGCQMITFFLKFYNFFRCFDENYHDFIILWDGKRDSLKFEIEIEKLVGANEWYFFSFVS